MLQEGDQPLSWGLRGYLGERGLVAAHIMPRWQTSPLQEHQGSCFSHTFLGTADELWIS